MFDWLGPMLARGYSGLTDLANAVRDAITRMILTFVAVFLGWMREATYVATASVSLLYAIIRMWHSLADALWRLAFWTLPNLTASIIATTFHYIEQQVTQAYNYAVYVMGLLRTEVAGWVNSVSVWVQNQVARLADTINQMITLLNTVAKRVFELLTDPQALADWIGGHIVSAVWRWALGNAETFARLAMGNATQLALSGATVIERIIADLFL